MQVSLVCVNKIRVKNPSLLLIDHAEIEKVEITTDRHWTDVEDADRGEKYVNITVRKRDGR